MLNAEVYKFFNRFEGCDSEESMASIANGLEGYERIVNNVQVQKRSDGSYGLRGEVSYGSEKVILLYFNSKFHRQIMLGLLSKGLKKSELEKLADDLARKLQDANMRIRDERAAKKIH